MGQISSRFSKYVRYMMMLYGALAIFILAGQNVSGPIGDTVHDLTAPIFILGVILGLSYLGLGVSIASNKEYPTGIRILAPIVGLAIGFVVFLGGAWLSLIASESNVHEGGD